jgi:hypothetical protein
MTELLRLAELCEKATGPDRELDALIWCALNGKRYRSHNPAYGRADETQVEFTEPPKRTALVSGRGTSGHAKAYTASIDAAMTLVPEGWWRNVLDADNGDCMVELEAENPDRQVYVRAKTWPLAICAAALRALAIKDNSNGK